VTAVKTETRWWTSEANPPCVGWCDSVHAADEFADGGGLTCWRTVIKADRFEVTVVAWIGVTDDEMPDQLEAMPPTIDVMVGADGITADEALTLARAIHAGVRLCDQTRRPPRS